MDNFLERAEKLNYNGSLYAEYYKDMQSTGLRIRTKDRYLQVIIMMFEKLDKDIKDITNEDIRTYLQTQRSDNNKNFLLGRLSDLEKYARKNHIAVNFDMSKFETIKSANIDAKHKAKALSLNEINDIRQLLWTEKNFRYLLFIELAYIYGLALQELCECSIENFNRENCSIHIPCTNKDIKIPERLKPYILADAENILAKVTTTIIRYCYTQTGDKLDIDFCWQDIQETRKVFFIKCPFCHFQFPNEFDYWAGVEYHGDPNGRVYIACRDCAEKLGHEHEV